MREQHERGVRRLEFHIAREARDRYQFDQALFTTTGNVIFANFRAARTFAQRMNQKRDLVTYPEKVVRAGQINAMGLIDEILHFVIGQFQQQRAPQAMAQAVAWVEEKLGPEALQATLRKFADAFPPLAVYRQEISLDDYLSGETDGIPNQQLLLEELLMLWLENMNPAYAPYVELFNDAALKKETAYLAVIAEVQAFFATQPTFGPDNQMLVDMLRSPAIAVPHSLSGQLEYILTRWGLLIGKFLYRLLSSLDLIKEEEKAIFSGAGPALVYDYSSLGAEPEHFSEDREWMPRLVLMAKNAYVWLDQLSKQYGRAITTLDAIPNEELERLARGGFTGLWLIGLWERSDASQRIKQWCGNADAVASAYSLHSYDIAGDLGGNGALERLRERAWAHGIRLASDMVPNHMGIDSAWVMEHPDWFIGLDYSPFPSYSFSGSSVSNDSRVGIYIEDHYFSHSDAAVVFKRVDHLTGSTRYIYHGNDGTSMPWNDTAQLNFLIPQVREAVIQTILHVARQFPVIRFDAAMTLAKKHYQRLWFPEPGSGGAIPSRAEHGMTRPQFETVFPEEFWRQVVDRIAAEAPDTLLLAEAFWLMEGYFVRTLGMHRVYNSAFMNMLRDEDNAKYRSVMKNTMEFDLDILKRYVNFMNNPDERTAVDQFGSGDKYFGVCVLMATLPGLPMFGHGQLEGYSEKYGMEFRRAYWDERPNAWLVARHEREIFPLLHRRHIFAEARDFLLYDFFAPEGHVNEDVFAYSNRCGDERGLVVYHNKFSSARGWVRTSAAFAQKTAEGKKMVQRSLGEGLGVRHDGNYYTIFRDHISGLEFIRNSKDLHERGLYIELNAYQYQVFLDFREVCDNEWHHYGHLHAYLNGRGVPNIEEALQEIFLRPIHGPLKELANAGMLNYLLASRLTLSGTEINVAALDEVEAKALTLLREVKGFTDGGGDAAALAGELRAEMAALLHLPLFAGRFPGGTELPAREYAEAIAYLYDGLTDNPATWCTLFGWLFVHALGKVINAEEYEETSRSWIDEWLLGRMLAGALTDLGVEENACWRAVATIELLTTHQRWFTAADHPHLVLTRWLEDPEIQRFLQINRHQDVLWFNQESFERLLWWMYAVAAVTLSAEQNSTPEDVARRMLACYHTLAQLRRAAETSGFQVERLLDAVRPVTNV